MQTDTTLRELPKYKCHKEVHALKIKTVACDEVTQGGILVFEDSAYAPRPMPFDWIYKHMPQPGGYWVQYKDGYESFSPGQEFEDGYTRV